MEDTLYIQNLEEFILDENKIVTYKWLSLALEVPINNAKLMLQNFVQQKRNGGDGDDLHVFYLVVGILKVEGDPLSMNYHVEIVPEEQWEASSKKYRVIVSKHIYSVQKCLVKDSATLYQAQYEKNKENIQEMSKFSAISCPAAILQPSSDRTVVIKNEDAIKLNKVSKQTPVAAQKKPIGISAMFGQSSNKTKKDEPKAESKIKEEPNSQSAKPKPGVMSMFAKQTTKAQGKSKTEKVVKSEPIEKKKKSVVSEDDDAPQKKRRRVREIIESSSEEEDVDMEESPIPSPRTIAMEEEAENPTVDKVKDEDHYVPNTPETKPSSIVYEKDKDVVISETQERKIPKASRKGRKMVHKKKTSLDEDGYMVTETVWESTDASDNDDEPDPKKSSPTKAKLPVKLQAPAKKTTAKKKSPKAGGAKQTSMMSFFKKK